MFVIIGIVLVTIAVVGGFMMEGGNLILLMQVAEFVIIIGASIGGMFISAPFSVIKNLFASIPKTMKSHHFSKQDYLELLKSFNDLFAIAQRDGLLAIESHIENPDESEILSKNTKFIKNNNAKSMFADTLRVLLLQGMNPFDLEALMDAEIKTVEIETQPIINLLSKTGDSMPGLGIVAAVLGIIVTMGSVSEGAEVVGHHVAAALVGTFLGVLFAYGYINPLATNLEHLLEEKMQFLNTIKACILAFAKGNPPIITVEIARRTINSDDRPSFSELENFIRGKKENS